MRFLDFKKVKNVERKKAEELFGTAAEPSALASKVSLFVVLVCLKAKPNFEQIMGVKSRTFEAPSENGVAGATTSKNYRVKLTDAERKKVEVLIKNAKTLQDIIRLEKELNEGRVPASAQGEDAMEE